MVVYKLSDDICATPNHVSGNFGSGRKTPMEECILVFQHPADLVFMCALGDEFSNDVPPTRILG